MKPNNPSSSETRKFRETVAVDALLCVSLEYQKPLRLICTIKGS